MPSGARDIAFGGVAARRDSVQVLVAVVGVLVVVVSFADLVNMLVSTSTSYARVWPSRLVWASVHGVMRRVARRLPDASSLRAWLLAVTGPLLLVALLAWWASLQIVGFGLVWWAVGGLDPAGGAVESIYYSGVVFFTIGFGEVVPAETVPRYGALVEAFAGVATTALVIAYLPTLYGAYSERERFVLTLDHGGSGEITPVSLLKAWSPDADPKKLDQRFREWEQWTADVHETHTTLPLLRLFRSHHDRQHWVTALGVVTDAALLSQQILGAYDGHGYWMLRRATAVFDEMVAFARDGDLEPYRREREAFIAEHSGEVVEPARRELEEHGFDLVPLEVGLEHAHELRAGYAPQLGFLMDYLVAPSGFWPPRSIDVPLLSQTHPEVLDFTPDGVEG